MVMQGPVRIVIAVPNPLCRIAGGDPLSRYVPIHVGALLSWQDSAHRKCILSRWVGVLEVWGYSGYILSIIPKHVGVCPEHRLFRIHTDQKCIFGDFRLANSFA